MAEFAINYDYPIFTGASDGFDQMQYSVGTVDDMKKAMSVERSNETPLPPIVICPSEVEHINITLEKNQQCACKDCGKLFNSVWYLKQHAVKHSNDRPFKCKFCFKTYKFRSNLYQHKCPDRQKSGLTGRRGARGTGVGIPNLPGTPISTAQKARLETAALLKLKLEGGVPPPTATAAATQLAQLQPEDLAAAAGAGFAAPASGGAPAAAQPQQPQQPQQQLFQPMHGALAGGGVQPLQQAQLQQQQQLGGYSEEAEDAELSYGLCISIELDQQQQHVQQAAAVTPRVEMVRPADCIRLQPMSYEEVERYVSTNKTKIHTCRKCKTHFPSEETLERHTAAHRHEEAHCFRCESCPQTFGNAEEHGRHVASHASMGPWSCDGCSGCFRSNVALRRHVDACRPCRYRPFDMPVGIIETASSPLDPSSFIISEADTVPISGVDYGLLLDHQQREKAESGIGSSPESSLMHTSPARSNPSSTMEEDFDENLSFSSSSASRKKEKTLGHGPNHHDDDGDSGFRSRLNSVTQSCSPGSSSSAFSSASDGGSPHRKSSHDGGHSAAGMSFGISQFGMGVAYGQKMLVHEAPIGGGQFNSFSSLSFSSAAPSFASPDYFSAAASGEVGVASFAADALFDPMAGIRAKGSVFAIDDLAYYAEPRSSVDDASGATPPPPPPSSSVEDSDAESVDSVDTLLCLRYLLRTLLPYTALVVAARQNVSSSLEEGTRVACESTAKTTHTTIAAAAAAETDEEDEN